MIVKNFVQASRQDEDLVENSKPHETSCIPLLRLKYGQMASK